MKQWNTRGENVRANLTSEPPPETRTSTINSCLSLDTVINRTKVWGVGCFHYKLQILQNKDFISRINNLRAYSYQCYTTKGIQKSVQIINPQLRAMTTVSTVYRILSKILLKLIISSTIFTI